MLGFPCSNAAPSAGIREAGWKSPDKSSRVTRNSEDLGNAELLHGTLRTLLQNMRQHSAAWPFLSPVDPSDVPDYYEFIKYPMGRSWGIAVATEVQTQRRDANRVNSHVVRVENSFLKIISFGHAVHVKMIALS